MNAPNPLEALFLIPEGESKVSIKKDTKIKNAATFRILREDHTLGNLLRMQLHRDPNVLFAGYRMPHPLEHNIELKVQTTDDSSPEAAVDNAIKDLLLELDSVETQFRSEFDRIRRTNSSQQMY
eukprot:TRINITY_DN15926_c0_g1_i1.p1 TRINITY_DN15926_c0_g1~~TRINITY_DN15926_c0_g1_i1.p1  ORF type:complete len:124 (+),score=30.11 TRINITY_DN15926_c0_g1_i1:146-517(+)